MFDRRWHIALILTLMGPLAGPVQGQVQVSLQPRVSSVLPLSDVYQIDRTLGSSDEPWNREVSASTIAPSPALSVAIQVGDPEAGWILRSGITRSVGSTTLVHGTLDPPAPGFLGFGPLDPGESFEFDLPTTLTIGFAEAVFPLLMGSDVVRPYLSVGAAAKSYDFGSFDPVECSSSGISCSDMDFTLPQSGRVLGAQLGAGVLFNAWGRALEFGLVDTMNNYGGLIKHDVNIFVGITVVAIG